MIAFYFVSTIGWAKLAEWAVFCGVVAAMLLFIEYLGE